MMLCVLLLVVVAVKKQYLLYITNKRYRTTVYSEGI